MGNKRKKRDESDVETIRETVLATPEGLEPNNRKKQKKRKKQTTTESNKLKHKEESFQDETTTALNKRIDELSNHLKEITEVVKKLEKNSELVAISLKEKETLPVVEHECCRESEDSFRVHKESIFVTGFDCSIPKEDIKSALRKHFSSCGTVYFVYLPFHCKSGHPLEHAFLNVGDSEAMKKALALDKSYLGGKKLRVALAKDRREYYHGNDNRKGCGRCGLAINKRIQKHFYEQQLLRIQLNKEDQEAVANNDERN